MKNIIQHQTLREQVADAIRKKILHHELDPGMRITESELSTEFGVSHGPVREALRQLEQEGLVVYTRNVGCSVKEISLANVVEALLIRGSYELTALRACEGNISDQALAKMADILTLMKDMDTSDFTEPIVYDEQFHTVLIEDAQMPYLTKSWNELAFVSFHSFYQRTESCAALTSKQYDIHKELYNIYMTKNYQDIRNVISEHYLSSIRAMLRQNHMTEDDFPFSFRILSPC